MGGALPKYRETCQMPTGRRRKGWPLPLCMSVHVGGSSHVLWGFSRDVCKTTRMRLSGSGCVWGFSTRAGHKQRRWRSMRMNTASVKHSSRSKGKPNSPRVVIIFNHLTPYLQKRQLIWQISSEKKKKLNWVDCLVGYCITINYWLFERMWPLLSSGQY